MLHEDPNFASITVHEEVVDLVDGVLLLEHDAVFGHNQPGIRVF